MSIKRSFQVISPVDGRVVTTIEEASPGQVARCIDKAHAAAPGWAATPIAERVSAVRAFTHAIAAREAEIAELITLQMGRPLIYCPGEVRGLVQRATYMADIAEEALADVVPAAIEGFDRHIERVPLGVVLVLSPWNYPYLTAVNAVVPAILAGNTVILKHSDQTPLAAEHFREAFDSAGLPPGVFQILHISHETTGLVIEDAQIDHVCFTGSVEGGKAVANAVHRRVAAGSFIGLGLELGGKDPAYVRPDADLNRAVPSLVEGAFFNSGQSCCGVERIYVHQDVASAFIDAYAVETMKLKLGNPLESETTLGPVVRQRNADLIRTQVTQAIEAGARPLIDAARFSRDRADTPYLAPQVLTEVTHQMDLMRHETFGPVVGIQVVSGDDHAIAQMNDSRYGLTASIWSQDPAAARTIGQALETGTVFLNRCDYLDPALAWTGVKQSGRGATLSPIGFEGLTRPKSFHFRLP
jgi:acyl-CoA reductase-like NAD-dependent aldehyde dehydrogenase